MPFVIRSVACVYSRLTRSRKWKLIGHKKIPLPRGTTIVTNVMYKGKSVTTLDRPVTKAEEAELLEEIERRVNDAGK